MLGRFHEIGLATADIRASCEFYERLGFAQAPTGDVYSHPYGVLTDGRVFLGLHERSGDSPVPTYVRPDVARHAAALAGRGIEPEYVRTGDEVFNELGFRDPTGHLVRLVEARTYSPVAGGAGQSALCGDFAELSLPAADFDAVRRFWEPLGFVATDETDVPWLRLALTSDHLELAFHRPRTFEDALLVFRATDLPQRIAALRERGLAPSARLPRGLDPARHALLEAPEGTALLLLPAEDC